MEYPYSVLARLDADWDLTATSTTARQCLVEWQREHPVLDGLRDLREVLLAIDTYPIDDSTELVWALLDVAETDQLARRVVLQAVVPGLAGEARWLMSWARRVDRGLATHGDVDQMLATAAVMAIDHAVGRRRSWPLKSILRKTHRLLVRETRVRQGSVETASDRMIEGLAAPVREPAAAHMLVEVLTQGREREVVSDLEVRLLWLIGVEGYHSSELAAEMGSTPRAVAQRRLRAENRLAAMVAS